MERFISTTEETKRLAVELAGLFRPGDIVALYGDLGVGKTTFVGYLVEALGFTDRVQSPTFVVHRKYLKITPAKSLITHINHFDLYRIQATDELNDIGFTEALSEVTSLTLIEWPGVSESLLPSRTIKMFFEDYGNNSEERKIDVQNLH